PWWWFVVPFWPRLMAGIAAGQAKAKTHGLMPAPLRAARVMGATAWGGPFAGLETEAVALADLTVTPQAANLIDAYFASEAAKKEGGNNGVAVKAAGVLGAGVMGGGIAWAFANAGVQVRVKDLNWDALAKAYATAADYNKKLLKIRKLTPGGANVAAHRISGTVDFSGFMAVDVVVEAVVENLEVKRKVLAELENHVRDDAVIATNTSSLSVADMAAAMKRPQRFVGMHFFNPVNRMPLVEVVAGPASDPKAVATIAALSRRCGKTAIVVQDCPGFLVNRCLLPYLDEAGRCLEDGASVEQVDRVLLHFGMPMGPFALCDEIGLDVGYKVAKILGTAYGERMAVPEVLRRIYEDLHLTGAKGGKGFYLGKSKDGKVNPEVATILPARRGAVPTDSEILDRCLLMWINEAARCLAEGVVASGELCDLAMLMGTGFPPSRGGPIHEANTRGVSVVVERLRALAERHGPRFTPCDYLVTHARDRKPLPISPKAEPKAA
ncbi:MAG: 3-hydroxyacyl-CoA dehydrogenase NAD-binding domain-containing protein, partial [Planctomycetota bacterium]